MGTRNDNGERKIEEDGEAEERKQIFMRCVHVNNYCLFMFFMYRNVGSCAFISSYHLHHAVVVAAKSVKAHCYHKHCHRLRFILR